MFFFSAEKYWQSKNIHMQPQLDVKQTTHIVGAQAQFCSLFATKISLFFKKRKKRSKKTKCCSTCRSKQKTPDEHLQVNHTCRNLLQHKGTKIVFRNFFSSTLPFSFFFFFYFLTVLAKMATIKKAPLCLLSRNLSSTKIPIHPELEWFKVK